MVQQAVSFLSSPSVQSAEESKKIQFLEKKGLTAKEIELARARVAGSASTPNVSAPSQQPSSYQPPAPAPVVSSSPASPPVPPRNYAPIQAYPPPVYIQQPPPPVPADPNAFKRKIVIALLISGGLTVFSSILVQKLIYPVVRGITGARQSLAVSQTDLLAKLRERLQGYKDYLLSLHLGSHHRAPVKRIKDTTTTVEEIEDESGSSTDKKDATKSDKETTEPSATAPTYEPTVKQLDAFSKKLEIHVNDMSLEQLKATRAITQDLAEYITKETYALTSSVAYPTARYYGYNTAGATASGKGAFADSTTPESALKSEIKSLKGMLINWRNFPVAKEMGTPPGAGGSNGSLPNLVQQQ